MSPARPARKEPPRQGSALLLEDQKVVAAYIRTVLQPLGVLVEEVADRLELLSAIRRGVHDLVLLDLTLPEDDGLDIARAIRRISAIPIIMVTGRKGVECRIEGLESGADDYLEKPFAPGELAARVRSLLRRAKGRVLAVAEQGPLRIGTATLDLASRQLEGPLGSALLTFKETAVLVAIVRAGGALGRAGLYREALGRAWQPRDRSLDVHVSHLRKKYAHCTGHARVVVADRTVGYRLTVDAPTVAVPAASGGDPADQATA